MIWILLIASTTWLGYELVPLFRVNDLNFWIRVFTGWLLGAGISGIFLFASSYIIAINFIHSIILIAIQSAGAVFLHKKGPKTVFYFEKYPWFLVFITFTAGFSLRHLSSLYKTIPDQIPINFVPIVDRELSFINSVLVGCNKRRKNPIMFYDPMVSGKYFHGYATPLLYTALLMKSGLSYGSASIVICFMNTVATAFAIYNFTKKFTKWPILACFIFLFAGSWAGFLYFKATHRMDPNNDLVHRLSKSHITVWYQPFAFLLSLSKATSFSIAMAQYAILWQGTSLSFAIACLIPSVATTIATLGTLFGMPHDSKVLIPALLTLIPRLYPFTFFYKPIFREAQMRGTFYAPIVVWFTALGPIFPIVAIFSYLLPSSRFKYYLMASIGPFLILNFIREGNDHLMNACAIAATTFPLAVVAFTELLRMFMKWPEDEEYQGMAEFAATAAVAFLLFGGLVASRRLERPLQAGFGPEDREAAQWLLDLPPGAPVLSAPRPLSPLALAGRQAVLGDKQELFAAGVRMKERLDALTRFEGEGLAAKWADLAEYALEEAGFSVNATKETLHYNGKYTLVKLM